MLAYIPYMDPMGLNPPLLTSFSSRAIADDAPPLRWWRHRDRHVQSFYFSVGLSVWATDAQIRLLDLTNLTEFVFFYLFVYIVHVYSFPVCATTLPQLGCCSQFGGWSSRVISLYHPRERIGKSTFQGSCLVTGWIFRYEVRPPFRRANLS